MKFKVINLGCKVNTYESTYVEEDLIKNEFMEASSLDDANIIVVNTCSVTNNADSKCKKMIRRIRKENKDAILVVCGCSVQNNFEEYQSYDIDILLGNDNKSKIVEYIKTYMQNKEKIYIHNPSRNKCFDNMILSKFTKHTRAFIKIEDGCDNFCSYCVIPLLRGSIRCKKFEDIIYEANLLAKNKHQEIVLVGIHTGSYNDNGKTLVDVIDEISKIKEISRIRLSSVEITELDDRFMDLLKNDKKLVSHLHIPLQAGSDEILKVMNRKYDTAYYENIINKIRSIRPEINITTDVIVGHPYETEELFNKSYDFCKKMKFGKIHVFPYSVRNNTKAALMEKQVSSNDKKIRTEKLLKLSDELEENYECQFIGKEMSIITEMNNQGSIVGFTNNYIKINVNSDKKLSTNEKILVQLERRENKNMYGKFLGVDNNDNE